MPYYPFAFASLILGTLAIPLGTYTLFAFLSPHDALPVYLLFIVTTILTSLYCGLAALHASNHRRAPALLKLACYLSLPTPFIETVILLMIV